MGHQVGIFLDWKTAKKAHEGYPGHKVKSFKTLYEAQKYVRDNEVATTVYSGSDDKHSSRKRTKLTSSMAGAVEDQSRVKDLGAEATYVGNSDLGAEATYLSNSK